MGFSPADWLLPDRCCHCYAPKRGAVLVCPACRAALVGAAPPDPVVLDGVATARPPSALRVWSAFEHSGVARTLVHRFKYRGAAALAPRLAGELVRRTPGSIWRDAVIVPVPAHPANVAARGYDQVHVLATALGSTAGCPVWQALRRAGAGRPQSRRSLARRLELSSGTFRLAAAGAGERRFRPQFPTNVVLLDDVCTTGVTLELCASELIGSFHGEIRAVTITRAQLC